MSQGEKEWRPIRLAPGGRARAAVDRLYRRDKRIAVVDRYDDMLEQVFLLRNPRYRFSKNYHDDLARFRARHFRGRDPGDAGSWFYFPWSRTVAHYLPDGLHQELRTGRNRNLITAAEQRRYYRSTIAIAGLSVGSHAALTIAMTGGGQRFRLADPDTVSGDNLNRIRAGFLRVGDGKATAVARQIFEMNPYGSVELFLEGLTERNVGRFLDGADLLVEEMDQPFMKILVRHEARRRKVPVIMGTDNGDGAIIDVERYDLNPRYPLLHGLVGRLSLTLMKDLPPRELPKIAARIAGADRASPRMLASVLAVGKTLYSWPQLGTAATFCGATLAYLARRIILGERRITSGRYEINPDAVFEAGYEDRKQVAYRKEAFVSFQKKADIPI